MEHVTDWFLYAKERRKSSNAFKFPCAVKNQEMKAPTLPVLLLGSYPSQTRRELYLPELNQFLCNGNFTNAEENHNTELSAI